MKKYNIPNDIINLKYRWKKLTFDNELGERCSHTSIFYNNHIYIIGGGKKLDEDAYYHYNDVWKFDISKQFCECIIFDSLILTPRRGHTSCLYLDKIYIFGGIVGRISLVNELVLTNQLIVYDIKENSFMEIHNDNNNDIWPSPRRGHIATIYEDSMYIYGGDSIQSDMLRLYVYNIPTGKWSWIFQSNIPLQRELSLSSYDLIDNFLLIYGGSSSNKLLTLNLKSGEWRDNSAYVRSTMDNNTRRFAGAATTLLNGQLLCIFGGSDNDYYDDILCFQSYPLINFSTYDDIKNGRPQCISTVKPEARNGHSLTRISDTQMIMTAGGVFPNIYFSDMWLFELLIYDDDSYCSKDDSSILKYFQTLLRDDRFADIKITFDDDEYIMCHRIVLTSRCKYFQTLLENGWSIEKNNCVEVRLKEISSLTFSWIKLFLYSGLISPEVTVSPESLWSTIELSDILDIIELKTNCEKILMDTLTLDDNNIIINYKNDDDDDNNNVLSMLILAERFSCTKLIERILLYLKFKFIMRMSKIKDDDRNFMNLSNINELSEETLNKLKNIYADIIVFD